MKYWHRAIQERIAEVVYGLDAGGNPLRIDEYYDAAGNYHRSYYDYDVLGRLIEWLYPSPSKVWAYDWVGNWVSSRDGTFVTDPDVDWLDSSPVPAATYDYNKLGALEDMTVSANTDTFSYDDQELLSQVSYGGGGSSTMTWDADQQRQKLTNSGGSTYFVYDPTAGVPAVLVETDGENETFYVREPGGELIARAQGQTRQYYFFDRLGSTIAIVPAVEANPTDRLFYTPWGELVASGTRASTVGTTANPYRYVGELGYYYHHQDAGLQNWMQLGVRFYEPELGRFERRDPVRQDWLSGWAYSDLRPTITVDPTGLVVWQRATVIGAVVVAVKTARCITRAIKEADAINDRNKDKTAHCYAVCRVTRKCGLPRGIVLYGANWNEDRNPSIDLEDDKRAHRKGADCAKDCEDQSCYGCCVRKTSGMEQY